MKILVIPDVHGRTFWKNAVEKREDYDNIVFLGDYLDPYDFEKISVGAAIENFREIIDFSKDKDNVTLLLGNHDMPYFSDDYYKLSWYHCRHSKKYHNDIHMLFDKNKDMFNVACTCDNILFTHAGCTPGWIFTVFTEDYRLTTLDDLVFSLNNLLNTNEGLKYLYMVSRDRGGLDKYASCMWADVSETFWYQEMLRNPELNIAPQSRDIINIKQVFGHTLQAYYNKEGGIDFGDALELENNKMLDNGAAYILDTDSFTIERL